MLVLTLMATQAFCYNAIFFTYALILTRFYGVAGRHRSAGSSCLSPLGNFAGPLLLGPLFDSLGRKADDRRSPMAWPGALLCADRLAVRPGAARRGRARPRAWSVIFFFASAGASAAYLTAGECFPLEIRAVAISLFYAFGTLLGGVPARRSSAR